MTAPSDITQAENTRAVSAEGTRALRLVTPDVDIVERAHELVVLADLPGVDEKSLDVTLENSVLTFSGRTAVQEPAGCEAVRREFAAREYSRSFTVSEDIDRERIAAAIRNGVLRITLPKAPAAQPRKIAVQAN